MDLKKAWPKVKELVVDHGIEIALVATLAYVWPDGDDEISKECKEFNAGIHSVELREDVRELNDNYPDVDLSVLATSANRNIKDCPINPNTPSL